MVVDSVKRRMLRRWETPRTKRSASDALTVMYPTPFRAKRKDVMVLRKSGDGEIQRLIGADIGFKRRPDEHPRPPVPIRDALSRPSLIWQSYA